MNLMKRILWIVAAAALSVAAAFYGQTGKTAFSEGAPQAAALQKLPETENPVAWDAVYLGIKNYGNIGRAEALDPERAVHRFLVNGEEKEFRIDCGEIYPAEMTAAEKAEDPNFFGVLPAEDGAYPIQNILREGENFRVTEKDGIILSCEPAGAASAGPLTAAELPVSGVPGKRTVKNFLQTALMPAGSTLYVYGGGWDWQDIGSSHETRTIGVSPFWTQFFNAQDAGYRYEDDEHPESSVYPFGEWNQYYYAGLDCSGYVGWALYNTMYDKSLQYPGFVSSAGGMARKFSEQYGLGTFTRGASSLYPGDIVSTSGHVWIVAGVCDDGSIVLLHSCPTKSRAEGSGGGVQLTAVSAKGQEDHSCDAFLLADRYMSRYFPVWYERYETTLFDTDLYLDFPEDKPAPGVFHWNITDAALSETAETMTGLADPDGIREMSAEEVLKELFAE